MVTPNLPSNEPERLRRLLEYKVLDSLPEKDFDDITRIAAQICQAPVALITFIDKDRQFVKSRFGVEMEDISRDVSFCAHAILNPEEVTMVKNLREDDRFAQNPLVLQPPFAVFYAGIPLVTSSGLPMGTLCVLDQVSRILTQDQIYSLKALASQVVGQLELRKKLLALNHREKAMKIANEQLENFASIICHDLKAPLNNMVGLTESLQKKETEALSAEGKRSIELLNLSARRLREMVIGVLEYAKVTEIGPRQISNFNLSEMVHELLQMLSPPHNIKINVQHNLPQITTSKIALQQILLNLFTNAIHYNDKPQGLIEVRFLDQPTHYGFTVSDNGPGIPENQQKRIFKIFQTFKKDTAEKVGNGIGLSTVKRLVEKLGGEVNITSEQGKGTTFSFFIQKNIFSSN